MLNFNWNSVNESTFQGHLNKYTNAFKGYQTRYFVLDAEENNLLYFTPDEVRKKGPRGFIELTDCWVSPSNEDDVTFTVQTGSGDIFKLRAKNAKKRQKWIDKLRTCSGSNAADIYVSSLPIPKVHQTNTSPLANSPNEITFQSLNRRTSKMYHHQQTVKELKEVMRCVEASQQEFVETIDTIPDNVSMHSLSKEMLLLRSISQSCISSLQDSLLILTRRRTPDNEPVPPSGSLPQSSTAITNTYNKQLSQSSNNSTSGKPSLTVGLSSQSNSFPPQNKMPSPSGMNQQNETVLSTKNLRKCHLPCIVFRLLDYPAVSIPYFDQWQVEEFHNLKKDHPDISWRQLLSDQFYELRSANGKFSFKRGKSCLFKTYFKTLYTHLLNVPLFLLLIDQINDRNPNTSHFIGSCNVKLNELIEILNRSIIKHGNDIPLVEQQTFHCTLFNLMGTKIGTCNVAVRFCHYGTTILTHLPMLDDGPVIKIEKKISTAIKEQIPEPSVLPPPPRSVDTIVKPIHFVNEKKDVGLQLSRSDLPSSSSNNKSAQTRWTSTKTLSSNYHQSKSRYRRTVEDPSLDDPTITFYRPPPLYFNSDSDFLQMITPSTTKVIEEAKENRLSYLASIPIASFIEDDDENEKQRPKRKSTTVISPTIIIPKQQILAKDFLHNFPLLRSLVEEALALQQHQNNIPISDQRPHSAVQQKQSSIRPKSAMNSRSIRAKSVIIPRNINNTRRLYPPPPKTNQMMVTKNDVRNFVDRLSKPKLNKRVGREMASADQEPVIASPRPSSKPIPISTVSTVQKPISSYGTTRAHRLRAEFSRARRAGFEPKAASSPKSQTFPGKESAPNTRIPPSPPQILNTATVSHSALLTKVDVDITTAAKNTIQRSLLEKTPENIGRTMKSASTTGQDVTLKLNQTFTTATSSNSESPIPQQNDERKNDLAFSITDITDYFTDGGESSTRPPTR